jgi:hypothetical protein
MQRIFKIQAAGLALTLCLSPVSRADSELILTKPAYQPEVSAGSSPSSSMSADASDPTSLFLSGSTLQMSTSTTIETLSGTGLTDTERDHVVELGDLLPPLPLPAPMGDMPQPSNDSTSNMGPAKPDETASIEPPKKNIKPIAFLIEEYDKIQQKLQQESLKEVVSSPQIKTEPPSPLTGEELPKDLKEKSFLDIQLQVTENVVEANEEFNLSSAHPMIDWLAMKGVSEENKEALMRAESRRKAMAEAAKQAEKNGRRVLFVVNGKIVPFFFNIPLFLKGDYHLYILNENDFAPQIPVE